MCNCIDELNEILENDSSPILNNTKVVSTFSLDPNLGEFETRITILTEKRDIKNKNRAVIVSPSYCPFCGDKYHQEE